MTVFGAFLWKNEALSHGFLFWSCHYVGWTMTSGIFQTLILGGRQIKQFQKFRTQTIKKPFLATVAKEMNVHIFDIFRQNLS